MSSLQVHSDRSFREEMARKAQDPKGSNFLPKNGRIGTVDLERKVGIYNANYSPAGGRIADFPRPWTVIGRDVWSTHNTHTEALDWATKENK